MLNAFAVVGVLVVAVGAAFGVQYVMKRYRSRVGSGDSSRKAVGGGDNKVRTQ